VRAAGRHCGRRNSFWAISPRDARRHSVCARQSPIDPAGISWALFLGAMLTAVVVTAPLSDQVFHRGAVGYGWLNAGWGVGAFLSALYAPQMIAQVSARRSIATSMGALAICLRLAPLSPVLA